MRSTGSIKIVANRIYIECQPHVAIKLRRMFGGIQRKGAGVFEMRATPEAAYDLAWFSMRYRLDVDPAAADQFEKLRASHERKLAAIQSVLGLDVDYVPPEFDLALPPREYQRVAADLAIKSGGLLIADDLGIGKTVSAICALVAPDTLPALVVTMTHLTRQWEREIKRFAPKLKTHVIKQMQPYDLYQVEIAIDEKTKRRRVIRGNQMPDVVITNYHKLNGWADHLGGRCRTVIYDEVQELRHSGTKKYEAASAISQGARMRIGLSATPIYNYGSEIHSVLECVSPGALGERKEFLDEWCSGAWEGDKAKVADPAALGTYLRESGVMIRRTRRDVGRELPDLTIVRHEVDTDENRLNEVAADIAELAQRVLNRIGDRTQRMQQAGELDWRLRQATGIAKAASVVDFVRMLVDGEERVLLYGWHHEVYRIWEDSFRRHNIKTAMFTGEQSEKQKNESAEAFKKGEADVLIMSLRAGAGLDGLQTCCRTVVVGELDWSPMVHHQGIGRIHRDGQVDPVMAYYLVAADGSDPVIADVLGIKEAQSEGIRNPTTAAQATPLAGADDDHVRKLAEAFLKRHQRAA